MRTLFLSLAVLTSFSLTAQQDETEYLFGNGTTTVGGFGGPFVQFASVNNEFAVYAGGGGGAIFNQRFFIGGYGMGLSTNHDTPLNIPGNDTTYRTDFGHGGLWLGYVFNPNKLFHFTASAKIGGGGVSFHRPDEDWNRRFEDLEVVFVATPQVGVEVNVVPFMKINANAGYQWVAGDNDAYDINKLSSPFINIIFKFGWFGEN